MYAVFQSGSKQYRVTVGDQVDVEKLPNAVGEQVILNKVLMIENEGTVTLGKPLVPGAAIVAQVVAAGKGPKVIHFDYRSKHRRRRTIGHRQEFTRLRIAEIRV